MRAKRLEDKARENWWASGSTLSLQEWKDDMDRQVDQEVFGRVDQEKGEASSRGAVLIGM